MHRLLSVWVIALMVTGSALAQVRGQARDPFGGRFGVMEAALSPADAVAQVELMSDALGSLAPQRPGVTDTYVVVAGLWNDPVFQREAEQAAGLLATRFDAGDRTIVLTAGDGTSARKYPIPTPNNIQAAFGKVGSLIDRDEDLVVVFLTSHGGEDGALAIQEKARLGGALRAQHLRASLSAAGIKNRVVIVSACYSGHFILPFSDPNTIVMTAAAADKSSFGCQPERDWTYFGDAFFNHALRSGASLVAAFDQSLGLISEWEADLMAEWDNAPLRYRQINVRPDSSNPQKHVGSAVALMLPLAEQYGRAVECAGALKGKDGSFEAARGRAEQLAGVRQRDAGEVTQLVDSVAQGVAASVDAVPDQVALLMERCAVAQ